MKETGFKATAIKDNQNGNALYVNSALGPCNHSVVETLPVTLRPRPIHSQRHAVRSVTTLVFSHGAARDFVVLQVELTLP